MHNPTSSLWWRNSDQTASGKTGAVHLGLLLGVLMRVKRCSSIWWLKRFAVALLLSALVAIPAPRTAAQSAEVLQAQIEL